MKFRKYFHAGFQAFACLALASILAATVAQADPPTIANTNEPADVSAFLGQSPPFSVTVSSATPVGYQWRFNNSPLAGQNNQSLTLVGAVTNESGFYSVVVTNDSGSVTSRLATLTVVEPYSGPKAVSGLGHLLAYRGQNGLVVNATITGNAAAGGLWGTDIYTDDSTLTSVAVHMGFLTNGEFGTMAATILPGQDSYAGSTRNGVVSGNYGVWGGSYAPFALVPTLTTQPISHAVISGSPITFTSDAFCRNPFTYQWLHNGAEIPGETNATLNLSSVSASASGSYAVQGRTAAGTNSSEIAQLIVMPVDNGGPAIPDPGSIGNLTGVAGEIYHLTLTGNTNAGKVWGTGIYTSDSTLACAVVHAGFLAHGQTGTVAIVILPGQALYLASFRNGVQTLTFGNWYRSYAFFDSTVAAPPFCTNLTFTLNPAVTNCVLSTNMVCVTNSVVLTPAPTNCYFVTQSFTNTTITYVTNSSPTAPTNGLISWWRGENNALDSAGTNHGTLYGGATYVPGHDGQAFSTGLIGNTNDSYLKVGRLPGLDNAGGVTISSWVNVPAYDPSDLHYGVAIFSQASLRLDSCPGGSGGRMGLEMIPFPGLASTWIYFWLPMNTEPTVPCTNNYSPAIGMVAEIPLLPAAQWNHLAASWRSSDGLINIYANGLPVYTNNLLAGLHFPNGYDVCSSVPTQTNVRVGSAVLGGISSAFCPSNVVGTLRPAWLDETRVYNRALSSSEISQIYSGSGATVVTQYTTNVVTNLVTLVCPGSATGSSSPVSYCVNVTNTFCVAASQIPGPTNNFVCSNFVFQVCTNLAPVLSNHVQCSSTVTTNCTTGSAVVTNLDFCTARSGKLMVFPAANTVNLRWSSQTNAFYLLQASDELVPLLWTNLWGIGPGIGSNLNVFEPTTTRPKRFYRLLSTEP